MLYPIKFRPQFRSVIWGGEKMATFKGVDAAGMHNIGESWEISDVYGHESVVDGGAFDGWPISHLMMEFGPQLVGRHVYEKYGLEFPLLVKFIDAREDLSIQVHPDDAVAARRYNGNGKTEMWYVIEAEEGARLISGLKSALTPEEYEDRVADGTITDVLARHDVAAGDVFFVPAGRIHSICGGCFVAEIQQTSDITYRIYDYGRPGFDGKPRELHTILAKDAIDYHVYDNYRTDYKAERNCETELVKCEFFTTSLFDLDAGYHRDMRGLDSFMIVMCVEGGGELLVSEPLREDGPSKGHLTPVRCGETVLIPASSTGVTFRPDGHMKVLASYIE